MVEQQVNPPLDREKINYARELIENRHPMKDTPLYVTWPFLKYICCCLVKRRKRSFKLGLKRAIRMKLDLKVPKSDLRIEEDPFLLLGYGMNSYFQVMVELIWMCLVICLVAFPLMGIFAKYDALSAAGGLSVYSLGNMGGSNAFCTQANFADKKSGLVAQCNTGYLSTTAIAENTGAPLLDFGIIQASSDSFNYCANSAFTDPNNCSSYVNTSKLTAAIEKCNGK